MKGTETEGERPTKFGETSLSSLLLLHSSLITLPPHSSESRGDKAFTEGLGHLEAVCSLRSLHGCSSEGEGHLGKSEPDKDAIMGEWRNGSLLGELRMPEYDLVESGQGLPRWAELDTKGRGL